MATSWRKKIRMHNQLLNDLDDKLNQEKFEEVIHIVDKIIDKRELFTDAEKSGYSLLIPHKGLNNLYKGIDDLILSTKVCSKWTISHEFADL